MTTITRVANPRLALYSFNATSDKGKAEQLDVLFQITGRTQTNFHKWHPLIAEPFMYPPSNYESRFKPPFGKNVFYGSFSREPTLYESAFYIIRERLNLSINDADIRTIFSVDAIELNNIDVGQAANAVRIMDRQSFIEAHQFINLNPQATFIKYPSCRDVNKRMNIAILDISRLNKAPLANDTISFSYDSAKKEILWAEDNLTINWTDVS
jgi:hypothetical protein